MFVLQGETYEMGSYDFFFRTNCADLKPSDMVTWGHRPVVTAYRVLTSLSVKK
jgi:hypothetical protein